MNDFWVSSGYGVSKSDPNTGIIESQNINVSGQETKLVMKVEHGIRPNSMFHFHNQFSFLTGNVYVLTLYDSRIWIRFRNTVST